MLIVKSAILFKLFNTDLKSIKNKYVKSEYKINHRLEIEVNSHTFQKFIFDVNKNLSNGSKLELIELLGVNKIVLFNLSDFDKAECSIPLNIFIRIILSEIVFVDDFSYSFSDLYKVNVIKLDNNYKIYDVTPNEELDALNLVRLINLPGESFSVRINHKTDSYKDKILKNLNITDETRLYKGVDSVFYDNHYIELVSGILNVVKLNGDCCCINIPHTRGVGVLNYMDKTMGVEYIISLNKNELHQSYLNRRRLIYSEPHGTKCKLVVYNLHLNRNLHLMILSISGISSKSSYVLKTDYNSDFIENDVYLI